MPRVEFTDREWDTLCEGPVWGGQLHSPAQLKDMILRIGAGQLAIGNVEQTATAEAEIVDIEDEPEVEDDELTEPPNE